MVTVACVNSGVVHGDAWQWLDPERPWGRAPRWPAWVAAGVLGGAASVGLRIAAGSMFTQPLPWVFSYPAVVLLALLYDGRAGVVGAATAIGGIFLADALGMGPRPDPAGVVIFAGMAVVVGWLTQSQRGTRNLLAAAAVRERRRAEEISGHAERHRQAQEALRASEAEFRATFEIAGVGIAQADPTTWRFVRVNRRFCEIAGRSAEQLAGMTTSDLTHPDDRAADRAVIADAIAGKAPGWTSIKRYVRPDGTEVWVEVSGTVVRDGEGRPLRTLSITQDINARVEAEAEVRAHSERLEDKVRQRTEELERSHARLRISERLAALGTLAAGLGHDLGNLLLPVRVRLESLEARKLDSEGREDVAAIARCVAYLGRLTAGLRLTAADPEKDPQTAVTDVATWWREVEPMMRNVVPPGVVLEAGVVEGLPPARIGPARLTQIVFNLVQNAADALRDRGTGRVRVTAAAGEPGEVVLEVTDDGPGMPPEVRDRAMEPFFTTKPRGMSTGLGLSLVHGLVSRAGGSLRLESRPGVGTRFIITLGALPSDGRAAPLVAAVRLRDARLRSFVMGTLRGFGVVVGETPGGGGAPDVVVVDADDAAALEAGGGTTFVVAVGPGPAPKAPLGAHVADAGRFGEVRAALGRAVDVCRATAASSS